MVLFQEPGVAVAQWSVVSRSVLLRRGFDGVVSTWPMAHENFAIVASPAGADIDLPDAVFIQGPARGSIGAAKVGMRL